MTRWVVPEWSGRRGKAHLLRVKRTVWATCWRHVGLHPTADDGRPKCKRCLAAEEKAVVSHASDRATERGVE